jgi:alcohol dehydrogenase
VTCAASVRSLRRRGRHVQVGLPLGPDAEPRLPMMDVIARELRLEGCHGMAVRHYPGLLESIARGEVDPARLIGRTVGLDDVGAELEAMGGFAQRGVTVMRP